MSHCSGPFEVAVGERRERRLLRNAGLTPDAGEALNGQGGFLIETRAHMAFVTRGLEQIIRDGENTSGKQKNALVKDYFGSKIIQKTMICIELQNIIDGFTQLSLCLLPQSSNHKLRILSYIYETNFPTPMHNTCLPCFPLCKVCVSCPPNWTRAQSKYRISP